MGVEEFLKMDSCLASMRLIHNVVVAWGLMLWVTVLVPCMVAKHHWWIIIVGTRWLGPGQLGYAY